MFALPVVASAERLVDARLVVRGDYLQPQFSPAGDELLVTGPQMRGLAVVSRAGSVRNISNEHAAGVHVRWTANGIEAHPQTSAIAFTKDDRMYAVDRTNKLARVGSGDRFFGAIVAPDGDKVVFQGLVTGLYVYVRSTGALRYIGPGTAPAWSPDSMRLAYEVTEDDGHAIVASDIYIYTLSTDRAEPVTSTDRVIERRPTFSPDGRELAYDDNTGGIFVGRLEAR
jgi:hypothetical protein